MTIGKKIKDLRLKAGLTRRQLANSVGITEAGLFKIEKDERGPLFETAERIAEALNISLDTLSNIKSIK
ncbi:MAG: helix-turn-helix transcriptional regulator [Candidatus Margulisbacteria bacterium]|nr:helix-turn-helix transcriptional regulator [Candidatus Margulisiibacteriota bacterium]